MKKKIRGILLALLVLLSLGSTVLLAGQVGNVYDAAGLLTESEAEALNRQLTELQEHSGWTVYAVTTADAGGKSATAYADDFFDAHAETTADGVAVLIDMDNREITISTRGEAIRYLTDSRVERILDSAYEEVSAEAYGACFAAMVAGVADAYDAGIESAQYNYDTQTGAVSRYRRITLGEALTAVILAFAAAAAVYGTVAGRYRLRFGTYRYDFRENGRVDLRIKEDRFVNELTTHRRIPRETGSTHSGSGGSSGRSSTHRSSSGRSHGGGSRKF